MLLTSSRVWCIGRVHPNAAPLSGLLSVPVGEKILRSPVYRQSRDQHNASERSTELDVEPQPWQVQKKALKKKFGEEGWQPRKRLSPDALEGIRHLHASNPAQYSTPYLAEKFEVSPEVIRRILRSKWQPSEKEQTDRRQRWEKRGQAVWDRWTELGMKAPKKWRDGKKQKNSESGVVLKADNAHGDPKGGDASNPPSRPEMPLSSRIL